MNDPNTYCAEIIYILNSPVVPVTYPTTHVIVLLKVMCPAHNVAYPILVPVASLDMTFSELALTIYNATQALPSYMTVRVERQLDKEHICLLPPFTEERLYNFR
jgi:ABC-type uncharacterized transport system permease subunit